jgi:hypothetical protein
MSDPRGRISGESPIICAFFWPADFGVLMRFEDLWGAAMRLRRIRRGGSPGERARVTSAGTKQQRGASFDGCEMS